jgi:hypothetical protein
MRASEDDEDYSPAEKPQPYALDDALESAYAPTPDEAAATWQPKREALDQSEAVGQVIEGHNPAQAVACAPARDEQLPDEELDAILLKLKPWQAKYVLSLRQYGGIIRLACRVAGVSRETVEKHQESSPEFAKACADAVEDSTDLVEAASFRGATVGDLQPVYQQGQLVGYKRVRNVKDAEIMLKLRGRLKEESEITVKQTGKVEVVHSAQIAQRVASVAGKLFGGSGPVLDAESVETKA